jgi:GT2 family glycosyltransferase
MIKTRFPWAKWVSGPRRGPAANRNNGAKYSSGDWLVFFDDDCIPDTTVLFSYYTQASVCSESSVLEGRIFVDRPKLRMDEIAPLNESGGKLWSCNFSVHRKIFFSVGGFNELFPFACLEDTDMRYTLEASGADLVFVPGASVMHPWRRFSQSILRYCKTREVSYSVLITRWPKHHKPLADRLIIIVKHIQLFIEDSIHFRLRGVSGASRKLVGDILFLSLYSNIYR